MAWLGVGRIIAIPKHDIIADQNQHREVIPPK